MNELIGQDDAWKLLVEKWHDAINKNGVRVYNPHELQSPDLNFGVILRVPEGTNHDIRRRLLETIPLQYHQHVLFQNAEWYHITIQWAPEKEVVGNTQSRMIEEIRKIIESTERIRGVIRFPYLADGGFLAGFFSQTDGEMALLKRRVSSVWDSCNVKKYLPNIYDETAYMSQSRILAPIDKNEILALKELPIQEVEVVFEEALVVLNDKIMTPEKVKILEKVKFKSAN